MIGFPRYKREILRKVEKIKKKKNGRKEARNVGVSTDMTEFSPAENKKYFAE